MTTTPQSPRSPKRRLALLLGALALPVALAACGSSMSSGPSAVTSNTGASSTPSVSAHPTITISNFMFSPMRITVKEGATVSVTNKDTVTHTLTSSNGAFNTHDIPGSKTVSFTAPMKPGTYPYICSIHQYMTGAIVVQK